MPQTVRAITLQIYNVLLVEDDEDDYILMKSFLTGVSCCIVELDWVARYDEALRYVEERLPDVLLVDYNLNHTQTGIDLVRKVKESGKTIPAILVTGQEKEDCGGDKVLQVVDVYLHKRELSESVLDETLCSVLFNTAGIPTQ